MKKILIVCSLFLAMVAQAGQIQPEDDPSPLCYVGPIDTAIDELVNGDYDPVFDAGLTHASGDVIIGVQQDESGHPLITELYPCN